MGIYKAIGFLLNNFPKGFAVKSIPFSYRYKTLAVDASNWTFQALIDVKKRHLGAQLQRKSKLSRGIGEIENYNEYLVEIVNRVLLCLQNNIVPIFVFDGILPLQKLHHLQKQFSQESQK
jgi:5'-3' exonuclease